MAFGLNRSVRGSAAITASAPAASAVRSTAPRLPGFSTPSSTTTSGSSGSRRSASGGSGSGPPPPSPRRDPRRPGGRAPGPRRARPPRPVARLGRGVGSVVPEAVPSTKTSTIRAAGQRPGQLPDPVDQRQAGLVALTPIAQAGGGAHCGFFGLVIVGLGHGGSSQGRPGQPDPACAQAPSGAGDPARVSSTAAPRRRHAEVLAHQGGQAIAVVARGVGAEQHERRTRTAEREEVVEQGCKVRLDLPRAVAVAIGRRIEDDAVVVAAPAPLAPHEDARVLDEPSHGLGRAPRARRCGGPTQRRAWTSPHGYARARPRTRERCATGVPEQREHLGRPIKGHSAARTTRPATPMCPHARGTRPAGRHPGPAFECQPAHPDRPWSAATPRTQAPFAQLKLEASHSAGGSRGIVRPGRGPVDDGGRTARGAGHHHNREARDRPWPHRRTHRGGGRPPEAGPARRAVARQGASAQGGRLSSRGRGPGRDARDARHARGGVAQGVASGLTDTRRGGGVGHPGVVQPGGRAARASGRQGIGPPRHRAARASSP